MIFYLMDLRPPQSTRTAPLFPSTTLLRSCRPATARWSTARRGFHRVPSDNLLQGIQELERFEGLGPLPVPIAGSGKAAREIDPVDQRAGEHRALDRPQPAPDDVADLVRLARRRGIGLQVDADRPRLASSEARRGGEAGVRTGRSRWARYN